MVALATTPLEQLRFGLTAARAAQRLQREIPQEELLQLYTVLPSIEEKLVEENARRVMELTRASETAQRSEFERMEAMRNQLLSDKRSELDASFAAKLAAITAAEDAVRARLLDVVNDLRVELAQKLAALPTPVSHEKPAEFERPAVPVAPVPAPKPVSLLDWFKGNWNVETVYRAGDIISFRGSCYLVLADVRGEFPTKANQKQPGATYALIAAAGSPGPMAQPTINPAAKVVPAGDYTITSLDSFLVANNSVAATWTLYAPTNTSAFVRIKNRGLADLTVNGTIFSFEAITSIILVTGDMLTLRADGTYWNVCD